MSPKRTVYSSNGILFNCMDLITPTMPYTPTLQPDVQPYKIANLHLEGLIHKYIYTYTYTHTLTHIYICIYTHTHTHSHTQTYRVSQEERT
jgi:hypothetical protein